MNVKLPYTKHTSNMETDLLLIKDQDDDTVNKLSFSTLLHEGRSNCSKTERIADDLLAVPRWLWLSEHVVIDEDDINIKSYGNAFKFTCNDMCGNCSGPCLGLLAIFGLILSILLCMLSLLVLPLYFIGKWYKRKCLRNDVIARAYSNLIQISLEDSMKKFVDDRNGLRQDLISYEKELNRFNSYLNSITIPQNVDNSILKIVQNECDRYNKRRLELTNKINNVKSEIDEMTQNVCQKKMSNKPLISIYYYQMFKYYKFRIYNINSNKALKR
jgi:hypothetical protein